MKTPGRLMLVLQSTAVGGMETHVVDLAAEFVRRGVAAVVVVPRDAAFDGVAARCAAGGASVERIDTDARAGRAGQVRELRAFVRLLRRFRPRVVHLHTGGATGGMAVVALARLVTRAHVVQTEHDVPGEGATRRQRLVHGAQDRLCHAVVAVSRRNARLRAERLGMGCDRFVAVLNGVPVPDLAPGEQHANRAAVRAGLDMDGAGMVFGSLVRLAPGKGVDDLLRAFAIVRAEVPCQLLLVGDGPLRPELEALAAELGVGGDVRFAGNQAEPARYLDAMDAFVLAVPAGSMSIALLEAMARGLPPIITFCGPEEAVIPGETGLGAAPNDPASLAEAMRQLACDEAQRRQLGRAAREHVERHFSVRRVADDLLEVYGGQGKVARRLDAAGPANPRPGLVRPETRDPRPEASRA